MRVYIYTPPRWEHERDRKFLLCKLRSRGADTVEGCFSHTASAPRSNLDAMVLFSENGVPNHGTICIGAKRTEGDLIILAHLRCRSEARAGLKKGFICCSGTATNGKHQEHFNSGELAKAPQPPSCSAALYIITEILQVC